ncbi:sulfatase-like hydrolase/transferase [Edaphobacter bradus]|uniref:sulfatase-like hydrolase/transferase n=1 Tax=Edaphobacter bradus TaxID=2259016 RepID=UPI0021E02B27|nr:sulfatase-like hydrolase/transferase [Edaphobacter bradus]
MKMTHPALVALGAATLCASALAAPLISSSHELIYHLNGPATGVFLIVAMNFAAAWLLFTGLFLLAHRSSRLRTAIWSLFLLIMPWVLLKACVMITGWKMRHGMILGVQAAFLLALGVASLSWRPWLRSRFESLLPFFSTVLAFLAFTSPLLAGQVAWSAWQARALNRPRPLHQQQTAAIASPGMPAASQQSTRHRIIWLLLDELSYEQIYEHRYAGLKLDGFDRLAAQSTLFTQAVAPANATAIVVPGVMTGTPIDQVKSSASGELRVHVAGTHGWQPFDPHNTVFQDALDSGYSTSVAGWYNPYCRILAPVLDRCFWSSHSSFQVLPDVDENRPLVDLLLLPAQHFFSSMISALQGKTFSGRNASLAAEMHIADYRDLFAAADRLLSDSSANFTYLHMPVPHPGGIYNRQTSTFTTHGNSSYIDNLALADQYVAHLRQVLEERGEWDSSAVIVMGDHSWRTALLWEASPAWTPEDQTASHGGQFDDRPAYIVKLPGQHSPARVEERFATLRTRALLDGVLKGQLKTPAELAAWAAAQQ